METQNTELCVIGLGAVGLPLAALFAHSGVNVCGVDLHEHIVEEVERGLYSGDEPNLRALVKEERDAGRLRASRHMPQTNTYILATPTYALDLPDPYIALRTAITTLLAELPLGALIVVESTCAPGSLDGLLLEPLRAMGRALGEDVFVAHCPERVLPGRALDELVKAPRVVSGCTKACVERACALYTRLGAPVHIASSIEVAQAAKLVENAQREMNIAFANQVADWSHTQGLDVRQILAAANTHPRVDVLRPGIGAGGSCLPLATSMLIDQSNAQHMSLLRTTATYHRELASQLVERILAAAFEGEPLVVAILGASYKPNVADTRDSPTFAIKQALEQDSRVASVRVTDAMAKACTWATLVPIKHAIEGAHVLVCCVAHDHYAQLPASILDAMEKTVVADFCAGLPPSWSHDIRGLWLRR